MTSVQEMIDNDLFKTTEIGGTSRKSNLLEQQSSQADKRLMMAAQMMPNQFGQEKAAAATGGKVRASHQMYMNQSINTGASRGHFASSFAHTNDPCIGQTQRVKG